MRFKAAGSGSRLQQPKSFKALGSESRLEETSLELTRCSSRTHGPKAVPPLVGASEKEAAGRKFSRNECLHSRDILWFPPARCFSTPRNSFGFQHTASGFNSSRSCCGRPAWGGAATTKRWARTT